ncbi:hypothetical protein HK097_003961 [Rhizophlyctis rosea]|uniref:Uncharacterized protein n=1 Tax=Rhizophlyctis rosea TaxID=64517 RepID=A0AAD5S2S6_9FUNG|nr:hypothetical protein HK097_003961 [Rhizophlyctis rosea]
MSQQTQQPLAQAGQAAQNVADRARQATHKLTSEVSTKLHQAPEVTERGVEKALGFVWPVWGYAKEVTGWGAGVLQEGMRRYPPLKAFVYSFAAAAAVPTAVFAGYGTTTGAIIASIGTTVGGITQAIALAIGGFFYFWWLVGAFIVGSFAAIVATGLWLTVGSYRMLEHGVRNSVRQ